LRFCISAAVAAFALAASVGGAAAQYYPPPPGYYPPPPPGYYPPPPPAYPEPSYSAAPLPPPDAVPVGPRGVYRDASGVPYDPRADEGPPPGGGVYEPAPRRAAAYPDGSLPPQPVPVLGGEPFARPPADVSGAPGGPGAADVTGSLPAPSDPAPRAGADRASVIAALPPEDQPERGPHKQLPPQLRRQLVDYVSTEPAGTLVIDTPNTYLYLVLGHDKAVRYGIGVGREGFTWAGTERISRVKEWPDWFPPKEMIERQPYLPRFMAGGESNPLGARALYLGNTLYRIHGTNQPSTIGSFVSSGCIRLTNEDIEDLFSRVSVGTRVVVLPGSASVSASTQNPGSPLPRGEGSITR